MSRSRPYTRKGDNIHISSPFRTLIFRRLEAQCRSSSCWSRATSPLLRGEQQAFKTSAQRCKETSNSRNDHLQNSSYSESRSPAKYPSKLRVMEGREERERRPGLGYEYVMTFYFRLPRSLAMHSARLRARANKERV